MGLVTRFARQWVAGETMADALRVANEANARGIDALVNHLGEHYREKAPVAATRREYLDLLAAMQTEGIRGEVSLKPTQFGVEIDRAYLSHLETLFARARHFAVGSHDGRMIDRALALAKAHPTPFEFAMLQGVRDPLKVELVRAGHRVAEYIPYGPNWLPYFTRRLRERPRNVITMVRSFVSG